MSPAAPTSSRSRLCDVRLTFLGTGTSFGVPQIGCRCPTCTSADPRDRRTRTAALIETNGKRLLIDTPFVVAEGTSKPELDPHALEPGTTASIAGVPVLPLALPHGDHEVFGYRIGPVAYLTDVKTIPDDVVTALRGLDLLVLNALLSRPHPLHLSVPEAVAAAQRVAARRTFFTHLTHENTHAALAAKLSAGIAPAYDGLVIDLPGA